MEREGELMTTDFVQAGFSPDVEHDKDHLVLHGRRFAFLLSERLQSREKIYKETRKVKNIKRTSVTLNEKAVKRLDLSKNSSSIVLIDKKNRALEGVNKHYYSSVSTTI